MNQGERIVKFAAIALVAVSSAFASEEDRWSVRADEARVREIAAMLPERPTMCDPAYAPTGDVSRLASAERAMNEPARAFRRDLYEEFYENGNRMHYQDWQQEFVVEMCDLAFAEAAERKGRFLPALAARLDAICAWPTWVVPAHDRDRADFEGRQTRIDIFSAQLARQLARILWAFGDKLPAETAKRVRARLDERLFTPHLERLADQWWAHKAGNWIAVCHAGTVIAALSTVEDRQKRARLVEAAERGCRLFLDGSFDPDGYCSEGMSYWNFGFGHYLALGTALRTATGGGVDVLAAPKARRVMRYAFDYLMERGTSPRFSDGAGDVDRRVVELGLRVWPDLRGPAEAALPIRSAFPDGQVWLMRLPAGDPARFALAVKGGHNDEFHNHNDVGSYCVMAGGVIVAGDVGGEVYTERTFGKGRWESKVINSYGHPVPRVGGRLQPVGRQFAAKVLKTAFADDADEIVLDLTGAYDCPTLRRLERTFRFDRRRRTATVTDHVTFSAPTAFESPVMTVCPDLLEGRCAVDVTGGPWERTVEDIDNPGLPTPRRLAVRFLQPVAEATVSVTFSEERQTDETRLAAALPDIFERSAAHYRALDAAATPLMRDEKGNCRMPHGWRGWKNERRLNMLSIYEWTAGHFPGSLWQLYEATGDSFLRDRAVAWTEVLEPNRAVDNNHDVGFIVYCSFGNARRLLKTDRYDAILTDAASSLSRRFNERLGLIRSWGAIDDKEKFEVIPDNMMNLELLEAASRIADEPRFDRIARSHADVTMRHHFRPDGGTYHVLDYSQDDGRVQGIRRGQGASCFTAWSRGQSWAIYGYTMMYRETKDSNYLAFAQKLADFAVNHPNMPADGIPYWDYGAPGEERDSSAAAIMASGLLELSGFVSGEKGAAYRAFAAKQLLALASPAYFSAGDEVGHFLLKHGVGHKPLGGEIDTPLNYGDYYFLEALLRFRAMRGNTGRAVVKALSENE